MLHPFEDAYKRNVAEQQRRALAAKQPGTVPPSQVPGGPLGQQHSPQAGAAGTPLHGVPVQMGSTTQPGNIMGMMNAQTPAAIANSAPHFSLSSQSSSQSPQRPTSAQHPGSSTPQSANVQPSSEFLSGSHSSDKLESEVQGMKRKLDSEETDAKRTRQKTGMLIRAITL
jgi:SWI/SNF chromatin-remodeling complex subunit SWI1